MSGGLGESSSSRGEQNTAKNAEDYVEDVDDVKQEPARLLYGRVFRV